ncbi:kinase-like domain-containing protein [Sparassis latifolia]
MASTLYFPDQHLSCDTPELFEMTRTDYVNVARKLVISNTRHIHSGNSQVYLATLSCEGFPTYDVVCKVTFGKRAIARLRQEGQIYYQLRMLQGLVIPACYGLFEGELEDGPSACLVTEYCGVPMEKYLNYMDLKFRYRVIKGLIAIHGRCVRHGDFRESNIMVDKDQRPWIIDFDRATKHDCHCTKVIPLNVPTPYRDEFGCDEIWFACDSANVWIPNTAQYLGGYVAVKYLESPELLASLAPEDVPKAKALEEARLTIQRYYQKYGTEVGERVVCPAESRRR